MFNLVLTNNKKDIIIPFKVRNTEIARKWFNELCKDYPLHETNRFTNWNNKDVVGQLNNCIQKINQYDNIIDSYVSEETTQKDLNYLHEFFEDLRGDVEKGTDWFNRAPSEIQKAVENFNVLIHTLEADKRTKNHPTLVVTFKNRPRFNLTKEDCKHFTYRWTSGTVYIDYCQVGKTVLDVFKDNDEAREAMRPQKYYSADFMVKFGPTTPLPLYFARKVLLNKWMSKNNIDKDTANLGMIPVADIASNINTKTLKKYDIVKTVECIK